MKFSDGFWLNQNGYNVTYATHNYEVVAGEDSISVLAAGQFIQNRGMTLEGPVFEIKYSSPQPDTIKVEVAHFRGNPPANPNFAIHAEENFRPTIYIEDNHAVMRTGETFLKVSLGGGFSTSYFYKDKLLTTQGWRTTSYIEEQPWQTDIKHTFDKSQPFWAAPQDNGKAYMRDMVNVSVGENIYGFGEKFTTFVKNGQSVNVWNSDGGTCSEQSYKSIPFYLSSRNYGLFVNNPGNVMFEVCSETVSKVQFAVPGQTLEYYVFGGEDLKQVINSYTNLTGKPALVPAWSFGLWLSTSFTTSYDEATVNSFIDEMAARKIPLSVFHFDCFWMKEYHWSELMWDSRVFPDPKGMLARIHAKGLKTCVWINPYVSQKSDLFDEGLANDYFVCNDDGCSVFQTDMWQPGLAIVDFTNPAATEWYQGKLIALLEMGVDAFKTDFGERIPTKVVWSDGGDTARMHNYYSYLYNKAVFETIETFKGKNEALVFARSATVGGQRFPVHWGGDCFSSYESMWEAMRGMLSLGLAGFGYASHDIGGFESNGSADLYKRWVAFGLLSSHSRLHGNNTYRVPWLYDDEACDVLRHFVLLKQSLMPYLFGAAIQAHTHGTPMARAMILEFPDDPVCAALDRQFMLGDSILAAPVFSPDGTVAYYLPEGKWTHIETGEVKEGGRYYTETFGYLSLPIYVRANAVIAFGNVKDSAFDYDYADNPKLVIYQLDAGAVASADIFSPDKPDKPQISVTVKRSGDIIHVTKTGDRPFTAESAENLTVIIN